MGISGFSLRARRTGHNSDNLTQRKRLGPYGSSPSAVLCALRRASTRATEKTDAS